MSKPDMQRIGDSFVFAWSDVQIGFTIDRIRESAYSGLVCELRVISNNPLTNNKANLYSSLYRLQDGTDQERTAHRISTYVNNLPERQWLTMLMQASDLAVRAWRAPEPFVDVRTVRSTTPSYDVPGWLPRGETTILYADGESGKSMLALGLAIAKANGSPPPWGGKPLERAKVMYLDWETNQDVIASRTFRICAGMELDEAPELVYRHCVRTIIDEAPTIREEIDRQDIGFVVVDSIGFAASGSLTDDETARQALGALRSFGRATRLVVAHVSKAVAEGQTLKGKPFGSIFFWNGMRSGIEVRKAQDQPDEHIIDVGLYHTKSNDGYHQKPVALSIRFDGLDGPIFFEKGRIEDNAELEERMSLSARVRNLLREGAMSVPDLAEITGASPGTLRTTLKRMPDVINLDPNSQGRGNSGRWGLVG